MEKLLQYFKPNHYNLKLNIQKHQGNASGIVIISGETLYDMAKFHAVGLTIDRVKIGDKIAEFTHDNDELILQHLPVGEQADITITYHFKLNTNMQGAYISTYKYNGKKELMVSTQFESHYARECFPCIDEPAAKATFDLEITVPDADDMVIANTPIKKEVKTDNGKTISFEKTPKMSTYLLAFCISKLQSKSTKSKNGVEITTYCTPNHPLDSVDFANEIAADVLDYYDEKFGVKYPLKKLDQVAIPDFEAGAMENWGLVTYRESCLLASEHASKDKKHYIATVIAHELSHQWFGDLVTMEWWDDLWLNESFASVMENVSIDAIHPEYEVFNDFFTSDCLAALKRDALQGVQSVKQDVNDPAEIATLFDGAIVYAKGARLILMIVRLMGEGQFFKGIKDYFKKYKYSNTIGDNLWDSLQPYAEFNVKEFMDTWISQSGYPVITDGVQQRFLINGSKDNSKWPIPELKDDMSGHYLLNLSGEEFENELNNFEKKTDEQKIRLLFDRMLLSKTDIISSASLLDIIPHFADESKYVIWEPVSDIIGSLKIFFKENESETKKFKQYIYNTISKQLKKVGIAPKNDEEIEISKLRQVMLGWALYSEDADTINGLAKKYKEDFKKLHPESRYYILNAKMKASNEECFEKMLKEYQHNDDPSIKSDILQALTSAKNHTKELVKLLESPEIVKPQDHIYLFIYMLRNNKTKNETIKWLYNNWSYLEKTVGEKSVEDYPRYLAGVIDSIEESKEFEDFFDNHADNPVLARTIKIAKTEINSKLRLIMSDKEEVHRRINELS